MNLKKRQPNNLVKITINAALNLALKTFKIMNKTSMNTKIIKSDLLKQ